MVSRVILGNRGGVGGAFVSLPGVDVFSASDDQLMLATHLLSLQVVASGVIGNPGAPASADVSFTDMGFQPFVIWSCDGYDVRMQYLSNSSVRFNTSGMTALDSAMSSPPALNLDIRYLVTNIPRA